MAYDTRFYSVLGRFGCRTTHWAVQNFVYLWCFDVFAFSTLPELSSSKKKYQSFRIRVAKFKCQICCRSSAVSFFFFVEFTRLDKQWNLLVRVLPPGIFSISCWEFFLVFNFNCWLSDLSRSKNRRSSTISTMFNSFFFSGCLLEKIFFSITIFYFFCRAKRPSLLYLSLNLY